jgi:hypothetical protein
MCHGPASIGVASAVDFAAIDMDGKALSAGGPDRLVGKLIDQQACRS